MGKYEEALERARAGKPIDEVFLELKESEDERIRKAALKGIEYLEHKLGWDFIGDTDILDVKEYLERQKEQKPIIQDVELNDAVYDYVRDHFIAGADFTPEYIKKLMENAFFAGVDYYLLKQESESCEPDTNVEKVIENVILVYEKTQGGWVGGYDVDTLIVNLRRAFNKKEQQPAEWSEKDEEIREEVIGDLCALKDWIVKYDVNWLANPVLKSIDKRISWLKALHSDSYKNCNSRWKPSDEHPEGGYSEKPNDLLSEPEADLEKAARNVYESLNDVRRDMVELGRVLNARKED